VITMENAIPDTYLAKIFGPEKAANLLKKYFVDLGQKLDMLTKCLEEKNMPGIRKIAHQLKGSGKSYGFEHITEVGIALSSFAKQDDYPGLEEVINDLGNHIIKQGRIVSDWGKIEY